MANTVLLVVVAALMAALSPGCGSDDEAVPPGTAGLFAYISNGNGSTVSVVDTATNAVVATIPVPFEPIGVAVNRTNTRVYVASFAPPGTVSVIDASSNSVIASIEVGRQPYELALNPAGTTLYVANSLDDTVSVIDTSVNAVVATVPVSNGASRITVLPDGTRAYVTGAPGSPCGETVSVIDTSTNAITTTIPVTACGVKASPDGNFVYAGGGGVINTTTDTVVALLPPIGVDIAVNPSGTRLYTANFLDPTVSVIDAATRRVVATIRVTERPIGVAVDPSGTRVYVAHNTDAFPALSVIDATTHAVVAKVEVGPAPITAGQFIAPPCRVASDCTDTNLCTSDGCGSAAFCTHTSQTCGSG